MKLVIFGLSVSSSWGNGHATIWRGLCAALRHRGHYVVFFERDVPYYASTRDLFDLPGNRLILYENWETILPTVMRELDDADVAMVTSYCPDALAATERVLDSRAIRCFYDLDTPITLNRLETGLPVAYVGRRKLRDFDVVLSYAGGPALSALEQVLEARETAPLYGSADPDLHRPAAPDDQFYADLSYLGTASPDRAEALRMLFVEPARQRPKRRFVIGGSMYDGSFPWQPNIFLINHVSSARHSAFYCSARLTLNVTRKPMALNGYCPSGRLFEAAACGATIITDPWPGIEDFFEPGKEILVARSTEDVLSALDLPDHLLRGIGLAARERVLKEHCGVHRAAELERILKSGRLKPGMNESALAVLEGR
jgi:spore maturation protein CgeB